MRCTGACNGAGACAVGTCGGTAARSQRSSREQKRVIGKKAPKKRLRPQSLRDSLGMKWHEARKSPNSVLTRAVPPDSSA